MTSLKDLIDNRNKAVKDARDILSREQAENRRLGADEAAKADELLDLAGNLDAQIKERTDSDKRRQTLSALEGRMQESAGRQTAPSIPGADRIKGGDGASLTVDFGRHKVVLAAGSREAERCSAEYQASFNAYLRGDYYGERGHERLGLHTGDATKGGYLTGMSLLAGVIKFLDNTVFMRKLGTVLPPTMEKSVGALSFDTDVADADWTAEVPASAITESDTARFGGRELVPHLLTKLLKIGMILLRNASLDVEAYLIQRLGYKFAVTEEQAFMTGTGDKQPLGVFTASDMGIPTSRDITASSATAFTADDLINLLYDLKEPYQRVATYLLSREAVKRARKLKDGNGQYIWSPGLSAGQPGLILDRPYVMSEYVPATFTTGQYVAAVGDFSWYYIQDGMGLEIQRLAELLALTNQIGLLARKQTDAMPVLSEAFRRLKLA